MKKIQLFTILVLLYLVSSAAFSQSNDNARIEGHQVVEGSQVVGGHQLVEGSQVVGTRFDGTDDIPDHLRQNHFPQKWLIMLVALAASILVLAAVVVFRRIKFQSPNKPTE